MKSFDTDLKKYAEKISLKASERRELRERVLSYMEYHPLPKQAHAITPTRLDGIPSQTFTTFHFNFRSKYTRIATGVFAIILVVTPFVAERSVPGDVLYLVKTNLNESIQGSLVMTPYEKIEFETKLMERRIAEARILADEGKLTEEVKTQIADTVKEHADAVQTGIAKLRAKDADGAAIAGIGFNASLEVQSAVLGGDVSTDNASLITTILTVVNDAREEVSTNQGTEKPSFEGLTARVEIETTRAYELFETIKRSATPEEIRDIERRLSDVDRLILEAKEKQSAESEVAASDLATTLGLIQKLVVFMTDINIRESIALETIVPVVLSDVERTDLVKEKIRSVDGARIEIAQRIEAMDTADVTEKVTEGVARIEELVRTAHTALETKDIDGAEKMMEEAQALVSDVSALTAGSVIETPVAEDEGESIEETVDPGISEEETAASTTENIKKPAQKPEF